MSHAPVQYSAIFSPSAILGNQLHGTDKIPVIARLPEANDTICPSSTHTNSMCQNLLEAATSGESDTLNTISNEELIKKAAGGNTAAHLAVKFRNDKFLAAIIRRCDQLLFEQNCNGDTPLHCAARLGDMLCVKSLLADVHDEERSKLAVNSQTDAAASSSENQGEILKEGQGPVAANSRIALGAMLNMTNKHGNTALHEAVRRGHVRVAKELLAREPKLASVKNSSGESAVYVAASLTSVDIVQLLLQYREACCDGPDGKTALHAAVTRGHIDSKGSMANMLLQFDTGLIRRRDAIGSTPLHYVASIGDLNMVKLLLEKDASVSILCDKSGLSPLHVAAVFGHVHIIHAILQCRPDAAELSDDKGRTLLHLAVEHQKKAVISYVLNLSMFEELLNVQDHCGNTPLHVAVITGNRHILRMLLADKRVEKNVVNAKGKTPLDRAASIVETSMELRKYKIITDLERAGSNYSPGRFDLTRNHERKQEEEVKRSRGIVQNLTITFVLIATVSFAAAFTLPGGYNQNDSSSKAGTALLTRKAAFKIFLISDALAMVSSVTMILLLFQTGSWDYDIRSYSIRTSLRVLWVAIGGMVMAFAMGIYVAVASDCLWVAIAIVLISCGVPIGIGLFIWRPFGYRLALRDAMDCLKRISRFCQRKKNASLRIGIPNATEPTVGVIGESPLDAKAPRSNLRPQPPSLSTPLVDFGTITGG